MSDSENQPAAAPEQLDDAPTPAEPAAAAAAAAAVGVNGDGDVDGEDADVPQLEAGDGEEFAHDGAVDARDDDDNTTHTPTRQKQQQHLAPPEEGSELGSVDADLVDLTPRRTGSPADSLVSAQGISPSIQVCKRSIIISPPKSRIC